MRVRIHGKVQGVWYRAWTKQEADKLDLFGWVRNRQDGTVEALFIGPEKVVNHMLALCEQGSPASEVTSIDTAPAKGIAPNRFEVKPTV
ncbi:MAG: acylphosphatase [Kordiimonas sp.]